MCFFIFLSSLLINPNDSYSQYVNKSYIVYDCVMKEVLEGKNIHLVRSVASVSKIMSAIVAIENGGLDNEVVVIDEDLNTYGSSIYLKKGDKLTLKELLYGLMLRSGNDAANVIARVVGGSVENFVMMMNYKAKELGMNNSVFSNPSGLDVNEEGNLSTSYDLALLMAYAIDNETFLEISGEKEYKGSKGVWSNKNKLLRNYKNTIAGKTGFTYKAKRTLVTAASEGNSRFVVVTLDCGNDFNFHKFLYEKNFDKYEVLHVLDKGDNYIEEYVLTCEYDIYARVIRKNSDEYKLLHVLGEKVSRVYLVRDSEKEELGECIVNKNEKIIKKRFWDKIKMIFH